MLTGDNSYAHIARHALHPRIFGGLIAAALSEVWQGRTALRNVSKPHQEIP
jgi:hypothetical protein